MPIADPSGVADFANVVEHTGCTDAQVHKKGHTMKVIVFGAAGWLGRAILSSLSPHHQVTAFDRSAEAWHRCDQIDGTWQDGPVIHGDISNYDAVAQAIEGVDVVIHAAVYAAPGGYHEHDEKPFLVNLKGLWNVLHSVHQAGIKRVVHIGSCQVVHPTGVFFDREVRRPDGHLYAISKRLQEEMCRQFHDAFGLSQVVFRPCTIIDGRLGVDKAGSALEPGTWHVNWVCRHDIGDACKAAIEKPDLDFEILHVAGSPEADAHCNVAHTREILKHTLGA
ncbi:MAG: NAD(P)-dependent oxidoreductase [bacterium]|nr:NAD(P)-dependent oxidoreductase [bacterium]